ncbi:MAG: hypothetical protein U9N11_07830 [Campylobacterota bacterium]|nr:hypothetical protein [Campylobacterota bacterium]
MFKSLRRAVRKMFREFLVYHHSSLEYRAKVLTLMISSNGEMCECEQNVLKEIADDVYANEEDRAELLIDTVSEYHSKIVTNNGLDFEHLIQLVAKETKEVPRFVSKIDMSLLRKLHQCVNDEEERLFQERILEYLENLKYEYSTKK